MFAVDRWLYLQPTNQSSQEYFNGRLEQMPESVIRQSTRFAAGILIANYNIIENYKALRTVRDCVNNFTFLYNFSMKKTHTWNPCRLIRL